MGIFLGQVVLQQLEVVNGWGWQLISFVLSLEVSCFFLGWGGDAGDLRCYSCRPFCPLPSLACSPAF